MNFKCTVAKSLADVNTTYCINMNYQKDRDALNYSPPFHIGSKSSSGSTTGSLSLGLT